MQDWHPGSSVQCTVLLMIAKWGEGLQKLLGGVGASCTVYIVELARQSGPWDYKLQTGIVERRVLWNSRSFLTIFQWWVLTRWQHSMHYTNVHNY